MKKVHPTQIAKNSSTLHLETPQITDNYENSRCRFCKQIIADKQLLVFPCDCSNSIHTTCVPEEMEQTLRGEIISSRNIRKYSCKKCKGMIRFQKLQQIRCRSCGEAWKFSRNNQGICTWLTIGTVLILFLMIFLVILIAEPQIISQSVSYNSVIIGTAVALATLFILVCFFCSTSIICTRVSNVTVLPTQKSRKMSSRVEIIDC